MILWSQVHHDQVSDTLITKWWLMDYLLKKMYSLSKQARKIRKLSLSWRNLNSRTLVRRRDANNNWIIIY